MWRQTYANATDSGGATWLVIAWMGKADTLEPLTQFGFQILTAKTR
jgi:hypothetical protein